MIARLTGRVVDVTVDSAVIDVAGVGYLLQCSRATLDRLQSGGDTATLFTDLQVREDSLTLYGFFDRAERDWFRLLIGVQGVGGRVALAILSVFSPDTLGTAILAEDRRSLTQADGVGPKLAGRLVAELRDKVGGVTVAAGPQTPQAPLGDIGQGGRLTADAVSALMNLGYSQTEAFQAVALAARDLGDSAAVEALLTKALSSLAPRDDHETQ